MFVRLLLLLTVVPIVELFVMLKVHGALAERFEGPTAFVITFGAILVTGVLGAALARSQGLGVIRDLQRAMLEGRFPGRHLLDGALILAGGAMLLTPGFLTDLAGLSLLIPASRAFYRGILGAWVSRSLRPGPGGFRIGPEARPAAGRASSDVGSPRGRVIDVTPEDGG